MRAPTASIVIIGNEILTGKFADENGPFLLRELRKLGIDVVRITTLPDELEQIADTISTQARAVDYVFTSGGVGPTHDDVTVAAVAHAFAQPLVREPQLEAMLRRHWGDAVRATALQMADIPQRARLVHDEGHWPALVVENTYVLPGVPKLFARKFAVIRPELRGVPVVQQRLWFVADESALAAAMAEVARESPAVAIGSYPRSDGHHRGVLVTIEGRDPILVAAVSERLRVALATYGADMPPELAS